MIDWQDLHHFAALARTGSLSAAARTLRVDHATVGRRVAALERTLGLRLIDRLPRSTPLTADGRAVAALIATVETSVQAVERHARTAAAAPTATVRVSAPPAVAARLIAPQVAAFRRSQPGITLALSGTASTAALDRGEADLAVRMNRPEEAGLVIRRIGTMRFGLYASPAHGSLPPEARCFIGYDAALDHVPQQVWLRRLAAGRPMVFQAGDLFGQLEAAHAGLGAVTLPEIIGDSDPELIRLPVDVPPPTRDLWLVTYPDLGRSGAIRAVMAFIVDVIGRACPIDGPSGQRANAGRPPPVNDPSSAG